MLIDNSAFKADPSGGSRFADLAYFCTVNGVEYAVFSHIMLNTPPPDGFFEMAIVN